MTATCIDCGTPVQPTIDGPLCDPCAEVAVALAGSVEARVARLAEQDALPIGGAA